MTDFVAAMELRVINDQALSALRETAAGVKAIAPALRDTAAAGAAGGAGVARLADELAEAAAISTRTGEAAEAALQGVAPAAAAGSAGVDRLRAAFLSLQSEVARQQAANTALAASYDQSTARIAALATQVQTLETRLAATGRTSAGAGAQAGLAAGSVGNLAAQFNDIGIMLAAGQNPLQLAIQQGSQITQVFSGMGAASAVGALKAAFLSLLSPVSLVTIGVIAGGAALVQWGMSALAAGEDTETLEDRVTALTEATRNYTGAARDAAVPIEEMRRRYGDLADEMLRALQAQRDLRREEAESAVRQGLQASGFAVPGVFRTDAAEAQLRDMKDRLRTTQAALTPESAPFFDFSASYAQIDSAIGRLSEMRAAIAKVASEFGITAEEAERLALATREMQDATDDTGQIEAADRLLALMTQVFGSISQADAATGGLASALAEAVESGADVQAVAAGLPGSLGEAGRAAGDLKLTMDEVADAAGRLTGMDIAGAIASGIGPAAILRDTLAQAAQAFGEAWRARASVQEPERFVAEGQAMKLAEAYGEYGRTRRAAPELPTSATLYTPYVPPAASGGGGRGGGGGGASRPEAGSLAALSAEADEAMATLARAIATIDEKVRLGLLSTAEGVEAVADAKRRAAGALAELAPQLDALGPKGAAALDEVRASAQDLVAGIGSATSSLGETISKSLGSALADVITGASDGQDAIRALGDTVVQQFARIAAERVTDRLITPLVDSVMGSIGLGDVLANAKGNVFDGPGIEAFSSTIVDRPTFFAFAKGAAVMGEAGTEAVMPLRRTAGGELGVIASGGGGVTVNVINQSGGEVRQSERSDGSGGSIIDLIIGPVRSALASDILRGSGPLPAALSGAYGLGRQPK